MCTEVEHLGGRVGRGGWAWRWRVLCTRSLTAPSLTLSAALEVGVTACITLHAPHHQANKRQTWRLHPGP